MAQKNTLAASVQKRNGRLYAVIQAKENGKTKEYCGVKVFSGKWTMNTTDTIVLSDHNTGEAVCVDILCDPFGNINGFDIGGTVYTLAA